MPRFRFKVVAHGEVTIEADTHEEAALDLYNWGTGEIISAVENGYGWKDIEVDYEA